MISQSVPPQANGISCRMDKGVDLSTYSFDRQVVGQNPTRPLVYFDPPPPLSSVALRHIAVFAWSCTRGLCIQPRQAHHSLPHVLCTLMPRCSLLLAGGLFPGGQGENKPCKQQGQQSKNLYMGIPCTFVHFVLHTCAERVDRVRSHSVH